jgi:hypothetical protein
VTSAVGLWLSVRNQPKTMTLTILIFASSLWMLIALSATREGAPEAEGPVARPPRQGHAGRLVPARAPLARLLPARRRRR